MTSRGAESLKTQPTPLPVGFRIEVDASARELQPGLWYGGQPARMLRLTAEGRAAWARLRTEPVRTAAEGRLARRMTDAGLAHPIPPPLGVAPNLFVIIPVRDGADALDRCLDALNQKFPVLVVDDASSDPEAIRAVATRHEAQVLRVDVNHGPGAARNAGLRHFGGDLVAFVDSDTTPESGALMALAAHLADPLVAAVAPRIHPVGAPSAYAEVRSPLDLGALPALITRYGRVSYVPTAVFVARRDALAGVATAAGVFDPELRYGEDVDLVWRLCAAGLRVRYDPRVQVPHCEPASWLPLLRRRYRYGTSAAPLALRHPKSIAPLVVHPWLAATVAALLVRKPQLAAVTFSAAWWAQAQVLRRADVPRAGLTRTILDGVRQTWLGVGRYALQFAAPLLLAAVLRGKAGNRVAALALLLGAPGTDWFASRGRGLNPASYVGSYLADEIAYGTGVLAGCIRHHTTIPLRPRLATVLAA